ncbi:MAG TPA: hypothetical protein VGI48_09565 [Caldimonas sp.]|jgi:hypothetical protein
MSSPSRWRSAELLVIAFSIPSSSSKNQGLARACIGSAIAVLAAPEDVRRLMLFPLRSSLITLLFLVSLLAGCDIASQMEESASHAIPIEAEIESAVGKKPTVISVSTGPILVVTVQFSEVPSLLVPSIEAIARAAIVREFKKEPDMLTIAFVYEKHPLASS